MSALPSFARTWWAQIVDRTPVGLWQRYVFAFPNGCGVAVVAQPTGWHAALVAGRDKHGAWQLAEMTPALTEERIGQYIELVANIDTSEKAPA